MNRPNIEEYLNYKELELTNKDLLNQIHFTSMCDDSYIDQLNLLLNIKDKKIKKLEKALDEAVDWIFDAQQDDCYVVECFKRKRWGKCAEKCPTKEEWKEYLLEGVQDGQV